jgi:hypothetical protein
MEVESACRCRLLCGLMYHKDSRGVLIIKMTHAGPRTELGGTSVWKVFNQLDERFC